MLDMHVGVITSSLGSHGGTVCAMPAQGAVDPHLDDQAQLIPSKRARVPSYADSGFASWDATGLAGDADESVVTGQVQAMIAAAGHTGCGTNNVAPSGSTDPLANPSNGHEQNMPDRDDLQFACTFALPAPRDCANGDSTCECSPDETGRASAVIAANSPLCQPPMGGPATTTQYFGQANPGTRELLFARTLGARAAPASICPKQASGDGPSFGYVPALDALVSRIGVTLE